MYIQTVDILPGNNYTSQVSQKQINIFFNFILLRANFQKIFESH